jgi:hypothetical protein
MALVQKETTETLRKYITHARTERGATIRNLTPKNINSYI